jgi:hypothetical protein
MHDTAQARATNREDMSLYGWDDGKIYLWSNDYGEVCVSDEPSLMEHLVAVCREYLEKRHDQQERPQ